MQLLDIVEKPWLISHMVTEIDRPNNLRRRLFRLENLNVNLKGLKHRQFEWGVVLFCIGIAIYFALPFEPDWRFIVGTSAILLAAHKIANEPYKPFLATALLVTFGLGRSAWHSAAIEAPILPDYERTYLTTGWVKQVEKSGGRTRWIVAVDNIDGLDKDKKPKHIRVRVNSEDLGAGDFVQVKARLTAPPEPVMSGGYNTARAAYFAEVGGYGYAIAKPEKAASYDLGQIARFHRWVSLNRYGLADRILVASPEKTAGLQVALLTGIRIYIPESQTEALRMSGLAHVLAISGLHMGLVAGSLYYVFTLMLACIIPLSRSMDIRKPAALIGIIAATVYLILSGASVATQRAYIMAVIVFLAVILNRRAFSLRSVALAAVVTLALHPETLISVGFQMSFAAVTALIVVYRYWDDRREPAYPMNIISRLMYWVGSLSVTSLVAGAATGFFAAFHFKRVATYGLLGNLLAMPIFTFWVMPMGLIVYLSLPFGFESVPLKFMGWGLEAILWIAGHVANLPAAIRYFHLADPIVMILFVLGFLGLCLGPYIIRLTGNVFICTSFLAWLNTDLPNVRISKTGAIALYADDNRLYVYPKRQDRFGRDVFAQSLGQPFIEHKTIVGSNLGHCDNYGCSVRLQGKTITVINSREVLEEACYGSDIVVLTGRSAGSSIRRECPASLFDTESLDVTGGVFLYIRENQIRVKTAGGQVSRPWSNPSD